MLVSCLAGARIDFAPVDAASSTGPSAPSGVGEAFVTQIVTSPAFLHTGFMAAIGTALSCSQNCNALWISRDGGASWHRDVAIDWTPARITIAVDSHGHEVLFAAGGSRGFLMRSTDYGEIWEAAGAGGVPTVLPTYAADGGVVVADAGGRSDYVLRNGTTTDVSGSQNTNTDLQFDVSPEFPSGGTYNPALLLTINIQTHLPVVWHCDAAFNCANPTTIQVPGAQSAMDTAATVLYSSDDYAEHGSVFADTPLGIQKSTDGGVTFTPLQVAAGAGAARNTTPSMALVPGYREHGSVRTAYASVFQAYNIQDKTARTAGGLYKTVDGGATWSPAATTGVFTGGSQAVAVAPGGRIFASYLDGHGNGGLVCSTDGTSWQASCPAIGDHPINASSIKSPPTPCPSSSCSASRGTAVAATPGNGAQSVPGGTTTTGAGRATLNAAATADPQAANPRRIWPYFAIGAAVLLVAALIAEPARRRMVRRRQ